MRITDVQNAPNAKTIRRAVQAGQSGTTSFEGLLNAASADAPSHAAAPAPTAPLAAMDSLLALQGEMGEEMRRRQQTVQHGHTMLDSLERLRGSLLAGTVAPDVLRELDIRLAQQRLSVTDPKLLALMDDIELRVAVELAKLERAMAEAAAITSGEIL